MTADRDALIAQVSQALAEVRVRPGHNALAHLNGGGETLSLSLSEKREIAELAVDTLMPAPATPCRDDPNHNELTAIALISRGLTYEAVGRALYISEEAVKSRIRIARRRVSAKTTTHLIALCLSRHLIPPLREDHP